MTNENSREMVIQSRRRLRATMPIGAFALFNKIAFGVAGIGGTVAAFFCMSIVPVEWQGLEGPRGMPIAVLAAAFVGFILGMIIVIIPIIAAAELLRRLSKKPLP
jgi:hypothetical protein